MNGKESTFDIFLFSVLKQRVGASQVSIDARESMVGTKLLDLLVQQYPVIAPYRSIIRLAVNQEYVAEDALISPTDEIALITPVSGG